MTRTATALMLLASAMLPAAAAGQQAADMAAMVEEANRALDEWIDETRAFVGDVRIDAADLESFIEHYEGFSTLGEDMDDDEDFVDYADVLADQRYRSWAASNGLAAEPWLKKSMRIVALTMRDQMQAGLAQAEAQMPEQRRMIEQQCAQMDAEICRQAKASLEASAAMFEHQKKRLSDLPEATAAERELLDRYRDDLTALMEGGDEDWEAEDDWD